jgi:hypothetical protein
MLKMMNWELLMINLALKSVRACTALEFFPSDPFQFNLNNLSKKTCQSID